ncbi:hypothetical protein FGO68_gene6171 [Halteria grandinella]|uniref:HSF-type DNA-binding domain-containing protein n=1 Tax=Halteria grandinella TaxID=5974 RepID=A0A8J8SXR4_HALGN|nr:hypothetical protein FGO68_gene6171 [Halteria grandinella]
MEKFKSQVLPKYFTTTSYSTFVRQLNKYGFRKVNIKKDEHIFYHPVFKADNKASLHTIKRKRKTSGGQTSGGNSALLFSGASSVNLAAHRDFETNGLHPNLETIQQKQVNYVYPLTKMSTNQDHSSHPMDLEGQILFPSGFNRSSGQIPKQNSISHQEADSPNNPPTPVSLGPQQNPESPLMREVNEPPPHHASLQRLELYNQGSDEYKADTPNHTHNYSGRGNYLQKYGENISDQSHHQVETDCIPKSDQSGFQAIAEHFQNLATQFERHNGQQQDLLKEIKTMEVQWKQENAKTAKNILNINKEMKEEVKKLRELVDAYGVPILRDATQIINDAGGKLARSGEITFRQQTTVIKELRSVNEQLHNDKQAIHQTMINWIQEQVASHPTTIHAIGAMFQDFIHQRQSNNFNEQIADSIRGITSPSNNRGDLQYCENSLSHQANAPKAHEELKQNSACFVSEHRYHPGDSLRSSLNPAFKQEAGNTQLGKRATKALDQKGVFKRAKRHSFSKFRKPQQQVDPSSSINSGDQQPKFDDSQQNARQGAQEFRQANPFTFQNNADNFTMQLTKLASENCAKENKLLQRLSSQFNLSSPVTSGTPRNHNELLSNHDSLHQHLTSSQMRQRALSLAQTSSNQLPLPLPLSMLTINQSSFDPLQQNLLPQGMVSKTISHLEPAFIPSAQVALAAQNLQRQGFTPSFRQNSGEGGLMQQGFMSYPPQSRWIPNQQQQQTTLQLPPLLPGPPSILNNNQHQSYLDESPSLQFQMRSQQRAAAAWGKRNTVLSQFTQKRKLTQ